MTTSAAVAAKGALVAALRARATQDGSGVVVTYGWPLDLSPLDIIAVRSIVGTQSVAARGPRRREETFTINVLVSVHRGDDQTDAGQQAVTERAAAIVHDIVEEAVRADPTLGGNVNAAWVDGEFAYNEADPTTLRKPGFVTEVPLQVKCENRAYGDA